jgi:hypothetical protein
VLDRPRKAKLSPTIKAGWLIFIFALYSYGTCAHAADPPSNVLCRPDLASSRRLELADKLREITGWPSVSFDEQGALRFGGVPVGGSETARDLLMAAASGNNVCVIEDASNHADTVFCRVVEGRWTKRASQKPPVYLVLVDFADFKHVTGDQAALAAFNVGWGFLHELAHVVYDYPDAEGADGAGECESLINRMRRECGLAERADYFFDFFPGAEQSPFMTRLVRLAFDQQSATTNKKKRYWVMWDANIVGGLEQPRQLATKR